VAHHLTPRHRAPADQVFVDRTGRRRRVVVAVAAAGATFVLAAGAVLATGIVADGPAFIPGWPAGEERVDPDSAVIGPRPGPVATIPAGHQSPAPSARTTPPAAGNDPAPAVTDHPGRGGGRSNRPTAKPDKSPGKPT
jgi:hypothetical protein